MKKVNLLILALIAVLGVSAQKQMTKTGVIDIYSATSLFTIEAANKSVISILDVSNGEIVVSVSVNSFKFEEALVQEHFNENYMETHLYPKAKFKGTITNLSEVNFSKDGVYTANIEGTLEMHGVTNNVKEKAEITVKDGKISAKCKMVVSLAGYKIMVEESYKDRIKDEIELDIHFNYEPYNK